MVAKRTTASKSKKTSSKKHIVKKSTKTRTGTGKSHKSKSGAKKVARRSK
jgi:hypothetical protein